MKKYTLDRFVADFSAGTACFLVAVPLCLGIAIASGTPLMSGLIAGVVGGILVGLISGSSLSVSGPAAGLSAIVLASVATLQSWESVCAAIFIAGMFQIALGAFKLGKYADLFPKSVIEGMMAAIGLIIIWKQSPMLLGPQTTGAFNVNHIAVALSASVLGLMVFWEKRMSKKFPLIPSSLLAVIAAAILAPLYGLLFKSFGFPALELNGFVQLPALDGFANISAQIIHPNWDILKEFRAWRVIVTLALVASVESLISLKAINTLDPEKRLVSSNREMFAQGIGNMLCGFFGGLPVTTVIIRSSVNLYAGAKTKVSTIIHGCLILCATLFGAALMNWIPLCALAGILVWTGFKLAHPKIFKKMFNEGARDFTTFILTVAMTLGTDLLIGVFTGVGAYMVLGKVLKKQAPALIEVIPLSAKTVEKDKEEYKKVA